MTDEKDQSPSPKPSKPKLKKTVANSPATRGAKPRRAAKSSATTGAAKSTSPPKNIEAGSPSRKKAVRSQAAAPLLARAEKKISAAQEAPRQPARKSAATQKASYQPKTEPPQTPVRAEAAAPPAPPAVMFDVLALARPWMTIGWRMTATGMAMQARLARAAFELPPAATAMRQGTKAMNAWLGLMQGRAPKADEK